MRTILLRAYSFVIVSCESRHVYVRVKRTSGRTSHRVVRAVGAFRGRRVFISLHEFRIASGSEGSVCGGVSFAVLLGVYRTGSCRGGSGRMTVLARLDDVHLLVQRVQQQRQELLTIVLKGHSIVRSVNIVVWTINIYRKRIYNQEIIYNYIRCNYTTIDKNQ